MEYTVGTRRVKVSYSLRVTLIAIGEKMPDWVEAGCQEYRKRLQGAFALKQLELPLAKRGKNTDTDKIIAEESRALLAAIPAGDRVVARRGRTPFPMVRLPGHSFYRTLREKLGWGTHPPGERGTG